MFHGKLTTSPTLADNIYTKGAYCGDTMGVQTFLVAS